MTNHPTYTEENSRACGKCLMLWAARHYVRSVISMEPLPEYVATELSGPVRSRLLSCVRQVWNILVEFSDEPYVLHPPGCGNLSIHEQAIMMELEHLTGRQHVKFGTVLGCLLQPTSIRAIEPELRQLARIIQVIDESNRLQSEQTSSDNVIPLQPAPTGATLH